MNAAMMYLLYAAWVANDIPRPSMIALYPDKAECQSAATMFVRRTKKAEINYKAWCVPVPDRASVIGAGPIDSAVR